MPCPRGCTPGWMQTFPYTECYGCKNLETDKTGFITGCKALKASLHKDSTKEEQ